MIRSQSIQYRVEVALAGLRESILRHPRDRMLIQVFSGEQEDNAIQRLIDQLGSLFSGAAVLGSTTAGEIAEGESLDQSVTITFTCFSQVSIRCALVTQNDDLAAAGEQLADRLPDRWFAFPSSQHLCQTCYGHILAKATKMR